MRYFEKTFNNVTNWDREEVAVLCPFPHTTDDGTPYFENNPSAHINTEKEVFHCKVCGRGLSEIAFCAELEEIEYTRAIELVNTLDKSKSNDVYAPTAKQDRVLMDALSKLQISEKVMDECSLSSDVRGLSIPVIVYGALLDTRVYNIFKHDRQPKVMSSPNAPTGLVIPFDVWKSDKRPTLLCAGEKDMLVARSFGFNAITLTGGERAKPNEMFKRHFKGRTVYVAYDNDVTGIECGLSLTVVLSEMGAIAHNVTGHHNVCVEDKEDIADFFLKYGKSSQNLQDILNSTPVVSFEEIERIKSLTAPIITLNDALDGKYRNKYVRSVVQVTSSWETPYGFADVVESEDDKGAKRVWEMTNKNRECLLYLIECGVDNSKQTGYYKTFLGYSKKDEVSLRKLHHTVSYRASVADFKEVDDGIETEQRELECYTIGTKLQNGKTYTITYKVVPHPLKSQVMVMLVQHAEVSDDTVTKFRVDNKVKANLDVFRNLGSTPDEIMQKIFNSSRKHIAPHMNYQIWLGADAFYHTPLQFNYADEPIRGYLDVMIIGETRTGKSETAKGLLNLYRLGHFLSLKTATPQGLIGGSKSVNGAYKNTIGAIPRNHKRAVIMEEFSGAAEGFIKQMTEIKSSNMVRIVRVDGELQVPCFVRMLTLSNQRPSKGGTTKPLLAYPNGIEVVLELVGASEDIARYDMFILVPEPTELITPFQRRNLGEPLPQEAYQSRVRWVWSRGVDQVVWKDLSDEYCWDKAQKLNETYNCHIKIFGTEAHLKLARLAVSVAGMCCSTDESYENIVVTKEHIDFAADFLVSLYDNEIFKLKEYVKDYKMYNEVDAEILEILEEKFLHNSMPLLRLEAVSEISRQNLQMASGLDNDQFRSLTSWLTAHKLIQWQGDKLIPSGRYRKAMKKIDRTERPKRKV